MGIDNTEITGAELEALEPVELDLSEFETPEDEVGNAILDLKAVMGGAVEGMEMARPKRSDKDGRDGQRHSKQDRQAREREIAQAIQNGTYQPGGKK